MARRRNCLGGQMDAMTIDELDDLLDDVREKADRAWKLAAGEAIRQLVAQHIDYIMIDNADIL